MRFILLLSVALSYSISTVLAEESRQVDKHEHGVGELNIAIDGSLAELEFILPGADIIGFEYEAKSDEDLAKSENALLVLENYENLFSLTKNRIFWSFCRQSIILSFNWLYFAINFRNYNYLFGKIIPTAPSCIRIVIYF